MCVCDVSCGSGSCVLVVVGTYKVLRVLMGEDFSRANRSQSNRSVSLSLLSSRVLPSTALVLISN